MKQGSLVGSSSVPHCITLRPKLYLFLVGVRSAGLFSVSTTGFPLGAVVLLPMRGTISLEWAFIAGPEVYAEVERAEGNVWRLQTAIPSISSLSFQAASPSWEQANCSCSFHIPSFQSPRRAQHSTQERTTLPLTAHHHILPYYSLGRLTSKT